MRFNILSGDGQITFPIYRVPVTGPAAKVCASEIENLRVMCDGETLAA